MRRAQQRLAASRAQEAALTAEKAQLTEQHTALLRRRTELEQQVQQREAASASSQKQLDEVRVCGI